MWVQGKAARVLPALGRGMAGRGRAAERRPLTHTVLQSAVVHKTPAWGRGRLGSFRGRARQAKHRLLTHALPISPEQLRCGTKRRLHATRPGAEPSAPGGVP